MNDDRRVEIVRLIAGSLLTSVRNERELRLIAELLETEPALTQDVAEMLRTILPVPGVSMSKVLKMEELSRNPLAEVAYQAIQRQKVTRSQLVDEIILVKPNIGQSRLKGVAVREILQRFFAEASVSESAKLLKILGINITQDPYLRGIGER